MIFCYLLIYPQWCDSSSWQLITELLNQKHLILALALRPITPVPLHLAKVLVSRDTKSLILEKLSTSDCEKFVQGVLGVTSVSPQLMKAVMEKAQGNPFLAGQIVNSLKEQGVFKIIFGRCILSPGVDLSKLNLPEDLQGVIISRIDRLLPSQSLILKVASVIVNEFRKDVLVAILQGEVDPEYLTGQLVALEGLSFIKKVVLEEADEVNPLFTFTHSAFQEVNKKILSI